MKQNDKIINIDGKEHLLEEKELNSMFSIMLPEEFTEMDTEEVNQKYQKSLNSRIVLADKEGIVHFTFDFLGEEIEDYDYYLAKMKSGIKLIHPGAEFFDEGYISGSNRMPFFDFKSSPSEEPIYNLMFLVKLSTDTMLGTFNCPFSYKDVWKPIIKEILETIKTHS